MYGHMLTMFYLMQCFHRTGSKLKTVILRDCDKVRKVNFIFIRSLYLDHPPSLCVCLRHLSALVDIKTMSHVAPTNTVNLEIFT